MAPRVAALFLTLAALGGAVALDDFEWLKSRRSWTLNDKAFRSSAVKSNEWLFDRTGAWVTADGGDQWAVADLGVPMTVQAIEITSTGEDNSPKECELEVADAVDGPWKSVHKFVVMRQDKPQVFPSIGATARFWRLHTKRNWGKSKDDPKNIFVRRWRFLAGAPIRCGDGIAIRSRNNRRFFSGRGSHVVASAGNAGDGETFHVYCADRPDGTPLSYGDAVSLKHVPSGRWVVDGGSDESDADTSTIIELGAVTAKPDVDDGQVFWLFNPTSLDDRGIIERNADVAIRNRFTRNLKILDGQVIIRSGQYGAGKPAAQARFSLHATSEWVDSGCADGTREGFTSLSKFPNIAGCAATWSNSLGMCPSGQLGTSNNEYGCSACASGWHVCGAGGAMNEEVCNSVNPGGDADEVSRHVCYSDCKAQPGVFATAVSHASGSISPPRQGSKHRCSSCSADRETLGCGTGTTGAKSAGAACGNFPELMETSPASPKIPMPFSCAGKTRCLGTPWKCCDPNTSKGEQGTWRGVLCCKDNVFATSKRC